MNYNIKIYNSLCCLVIKCISNMKIMDMDFVLELKVKELALGGNSDHFFFHFSLFPTQTCNLTELGVHAYPRFL